MTTLFTPTQAKPKAPPPPPNTPSLASGSIAEAGDQASKGYSSMISTSSAGLSRKAFTVKRSLIGGA